MLARLELLLVRELPAVCAPPLRPDEWREPLPPYPPVSRSKKSEVNTVCEYSTSQRKN